MDWRWWLAVNAREFRKNTTRYLEGMVRNVDVHQPYPWRVQSDVFVAVNSGDI